MNLGGFLSICFIYFSVAVKGDTENDCNFCAWNICNPSIKAVDESKFDPDRDALSIWQAIGNVFVDKDKVVNILSARSEKQRLTIASKYRELYEEQILKEDLFDITFGDVSIVLKDLVSPLSRFYARYLKNAVREKDLVKITEIFTILPPCAIKQVRTQYEAVYDVKMNEDIRVTLSTKYPIKNVVDLILLLAEGNRSPTTDKKDVKDWNKKIEADVKELIRVLEQDKWDDKNKIFRRIFTERNLPQLKDIINMYEKRKGRLEEGIKKARFERAEIIYMTILNIVRNQPEYFSLKLTEVLKPRFMWNVNREDLNYIIVGRSSIDLADIKKAFQDKYGIHLYVTIYAKITRKNNDYYKAILSLVKQD